jgi:hypothetical protein
VSKSFPAPDPDLKDLYSPESQQQRAEMRAVLPDAGWERALKLRKER